MCGSLALNMCGVACGRLDLCYEIGFGGPWYGYQIINDSFTWKIYKPKVTSNCFFFETSHLIVKFSSRDVAAGALILKEAGGFVFDP